MQTLTATYKLFELESDEFITEGSVNYCEDSEREEIASAVNELDEKVTAIEKSKFYRNKLIVTFETYYAIITF